MAEKQSNVHREDLEKVHQKKIMSLNDVMVHLSIGFYCLEEYHSIN